ncbi:MAG: hypothetical protein R2687_02295 [Candidatus Nanopelagicales bacterium]|uniref:hypothetical protein n=1 Tax=Rhodococcus TaxID=1827 RepID=UPI001C7D6151|nr:hypothetical protein [Rhodococcus sp. DMU2021]MBX4171870.1 hypothetical protein [Rhodococcus sp. DMU2021]MDJ0401376.1 hypothetical protein [Rhodococcus rhodochrous]
MIVTVVLMLGALVLLAGFVWTRTATEPAPKLAALAVQACGALMLGAAALASASSWTAKLPILLSSAILLAACTYAYRRARQHSQSTD